MFGTVEKVTVLAVICCNININICFYNNKMLWGSNELTQTRMHEQHKSFWQNNRRILTIQNKIVSMEIWLQSYIKLEI